MSNSSSITGRLIKHSFNFGLGSAIPRVIGFFLIPVYTYYLTPADFGIVDLATSLGAFLLVLMRLGLPGAVTRFYYDFQKKDELKDYVTTIFWFGLVSGGVIGVLSWFALDSQINFLLPGLPLYPFVWMIILWAFLNSNTDLQKRLIQVREQSSYSAKLSIITSIITILLTIYFVVAMKLGAYGVILAILISGIVFTLQSQYYLRNDLKGKFRFEHLKPSFQYATGIFPHQILSNISPLISRSILSSFDSLAAVGLLGIGFRFIVPLNLMIGAVQSALTPIYFSIRSKATDEMVMKEETDKLVKHVFFFGVLIHALVVCFGGLVIKLITQQEFHDAAALVPGLVIYVFFDFLSAVTGNEITFQKQTKFIFLVSMIKNIVYVGVAYLLVDQLGLQGIVYSLILSTVVGFVLSIKRSTKLNNSFRPDLKVVVNFVYLLMISIIITVYSHLTIADNILLSILLFLIAVAFYGISEWEFIQLGLKKIRTRFDRINKN